MLRSVHRESAGRVIEPRKLFLDDQDREDLLDRVNELLRKTTAICYVWALLPTHANFLFMTGSVPLATVNCSILVRN
jgi:putative transposase